MKYILFILIAMLCSCSVNYHINQATKKGFKCAETSDTIQILKIDSIPYVVNDSIYYETIIRKTDSVIFYKNVYIPKTKWQIRTEIKYKYKIQLKTIYKDRVVEKAKAKSEGQKAKSEAKSNRPKGNLNLLFVGVAIGLLLSWLWKYAIKSII
jgi:hypothetical protein